MNLRTVGRRILIVGLVLGVFAQFVAGLRAEELDTAKERLAKCAGVPQPVLDAIAAKLNSKSEGGILRFGHTVQSGELEGQPWLVSAQLRKPGRPRSAPGEILTWVTAMKPTAPAADYLAVDTNARQRSDWPTAAAPAVVTLDASIDSRACVYETRPGSRGLFH